MKKKSVACPVTKVAQVLSDTWTILILHHLFGGPKRFCELERALDGISTRTLTLKLSKLTSEKIAVKNKDGRYALTERGKGLKIVEKAMMRYQKQYF